MSASAAVQINLRTQSNTLEAIGVAITRYGVVLVLLWIGFLKFTADEANGIKPLVENSPFMSWMYKVMSVQAVSNLIGTTELVIAAIMALRPVAPKLSFYGSIGAIITFLTTLSFLATTPGAISFTPLPMLGGVGQFLIKDVVLLGAAIWTAAEAQRASLS
jgi:reactive chlorine resistance protein C